MAPSPPLAPSDYQARLEAFLGRLEGWADLAFFPVSADLQYLTGLPRPMPHFGAVRHPGDWAEGAWMVPGREPVLTLSRMSAEFAGLQGAAQGEVRVLGDHEDHERVLGALLKDLGVPSSPRVAIGDFTRGETVTALHRLRPGATFLSASERLQPLRAVKSEAEVALMRRAGEITQAAFAAVVDRLRPGMTELEVVSEVDYQLRRHGAAGPSFQTMLYASGPRHPLLFGRPEETLPRRLEPPVALLFDFGAIYQGYCYDFGRTVFFGEPPREMFDLHRLVMEAQQAGIRALRAGATAEAVDAAARRTLEHAGRGDAFRHRLGHGIGLDVHEPPFLTRGDTTRLEEGMLFTIEPSLTYFDGFSARVEDVVRVGSEAGEPLTQGFRDLVVIG